MKPLPLILALLLPLCTRAAEKPKPRPIERERRIELERQERERRQREQPETSRERNEISVIRLDRVEVLRDFIASAPEHSAMKGWRNEIFEFMRQFEGRSPSEREVTAWMEANIRGGSFEINKFKGTLREVSDVIRIIGERDPKTEKPLYSEVVWNNRPEVVIVKLENGREVDLGERKIDVIATRNADARRVYLETKNADLYKAFYKPELKLLAERTPVEELVRYCDPKGKNRETTDVSRVFKELVKDIWLAKSQGRAIEWKANVASEGLEWALRNYGIELHVYH